MPSRTAALALTVAVSFGSWIAAVGGPLSDALQPFVDQGQMAGGVALVADGQRILALEAVGESDLATHRKLRTDDLFWIASMTKPMTAVCVLMLVDEGKLQLDDPVEKYLPEFKNPWMISESGNDRRVLIKPPRVISLRDLLTHTSGMGADLPQRPDASLAQIVSAAAREPLQFPPGSRWSYSNPGINTLGRIVEVVSGKRFEAFLQQRLLDPLGMTDTTFWPSRSQIKRLAHAYRKGTDGTLTNTPVYFADGVALEDRTRTPKPAGGLFSTAGNVAAFYQMMLNGGVWKGHRLLSESAVAEMTRTQTGDIKTGFVDGMSWGLGFQVVKQPEGVTAMLSPGTYGHGGAYATQSWADPRRQQAYVLMIQVSGLPNGDASDMRRAFQTAAVSTYGR